MLSRPHCATIAGMYTTYAIFDPESAHCIYVGQTNNFERRQAEHLKPPRTRKTTHPKGSIKSWLARAHRAGVSPLFMILEVVETEEQSLLSESHWIEKLAAAGQPLLNRWEEHQVLIEAGQGTPQNMHTFRPGKWRKVLAQVKPTSKKAGYEQVFCEDVAIKAGDRLLILPRKDGTE